jgi:hypothetical protein
MCPSGGGRVTIEKGELLRIIGALEELRAFDVDSQAELSEWNRKAQELLESLAGRVVLPEDLYHWLADADVRFRDPLERPYQERAFASGIAALRQGLQASQTDK